MVRYLLELSTATKISTGVYRWSFGTRNEHFPETVRVGPCTVSATTDIRHCVLTSETFRNEGKSHTLQGDVLQPILYVCHPEERVTRSVTVSGTTTQSQGVTDADIEAIGSDLLIWLDFDPNRVLNSAFGPVSVLGDNVLYYYNRTPAPATILFVNSYGNGLQLAAVGEAKGVTRSGSWESIIDSTQPNPNLEQEHAVHMLITMPSSLSAYSYLLNFPGMKFYTQASGTINFRDSTDSNVNVPLSWIPLRSYVLSVQRRMGTGDRNGDGAVDPYELVWRLEDLAAGGVQTQITTSSWNVAENVATHWSMGKANTNFEHVQSCMVAYNGTSQTNWDNSIAWLKLQYSGSASSSEETPSSTQTIYQLYDSRVEKIALYKPHRSIREIDIDFRDHTNTLFDPEHCAINIEV